MLLIAARRTIVQSAVLRLHVRRLSVCLTVRLSDCNIGGSGAYIIGSGVARSQRLGAKLRESGGRKSPDPAGSRGGAPVGVWGEAQKLKNTT